MGAVTNDDALSHLDADGRARMVDVSDKAQSVRRAVASGRYRTRADVIALLRDDALPKADVLTTARLAGIGGAKRTSELIPLCHPLPLDAVSVDLVLEFDTVVITATATTTGRTGVEMEALTAVAIAGLTLHDMVKAVDPAGVLGEIRLLEKTGGARGPWSRDTVEAPAGAAGEGAPRVTARPPVRPRTAVVVVASTRCASGERPDETGPVIAGWLAERGIAVDGVVVVPDARIAEALQDALASAPAVIITTGGTGPSPSDRTPEAVATVLDTELPGIGEAIRARGRDAVPTAALSRGIAGIALGTAIITLPGSRGGVRDGLGVLDDLLLHLLDQLEGGDHDA